MIQTTPLVVMDAEGEMAHMNGSFRERRRGIRGNALVEFALFFPLLTMLLLGAVDAGIYATAFISVQNAARAAALRNSAGRESAADQVAACQVAHDQVRGLPGVPSATGCQSAPLAVTSVYCEGAAACGTDATSADSRPAALVTVSYTLPDTFRFPLRGPAVITAASQLKLRSYE